MVWILTLPFLYRPRYKFEADRNGGEENCLGSSTYRDMCSCAADMWVTCTCKNHQFHVLYTECGGRVMVSVKHFEIVDGGLSSLGRGSVVALLYTSENDLRQKVWVSRLSVQLCKPSADCWNKQCLIIFHYNVVQILPTILPVKCILAPVSAISVCKLCWSANYYTIYRL